MREETTSKRQQVLRRLNENINQGRAIVGGGAGVGLSAKIQEAGGIDLIIIYNSGRYRVAGRGSLAMRDVAMSIKIWLIDLLGTDALRRRERHHARDGQ